MSSTFDQYYQYPGQGQLLVSTNGFAYGSDDDRRSKSHTPLSLINNPRQSPGPLSTPTHSRNTSQSPEQPPDQMVYDDVGGSSSESPTSIPTPDYDTFDLEMLDSSDIRDFYHQDGNLNMVSTQIQQDSIPAVDSNLMLSEQAIQEAFNASLAASQTEQYHAILSLQTHPFPDLVTSQPYNQTYSQNYTNRPHQHDPWNSERPQQNSDAQSGGVVFDPQSDPDYSRYVAFSVNNVNNWTHHNTDPNFLVSPNEPLPPPQDNLFNYPAQPQQDTLNHRHLQMRVIVPSPPLASRTFVNYDPNSAYFSEENVGAFPPSSPNTSTMGSSVGALPSSPYQLSASPQASVPSPGGSDGLFSSYQHSDSGMLPSGPYVSEPSDAKTVISPSRMDISPTRTMPGSAFEVSPEPEPQHEPRPRPRPRNPKGSGRPGGRALGTHLEPRVAKEAHDMRRTVACWHCVLQRDKCGPGVICERCKKRSQRPNADCGLGCSRVKLIELAGKFLPTLVTQMHEDSHLTHFVSKHIAHWLNVEITIHMTCGQGHMPNIPVRVYEFSPKGDELLFQIQYMTDPDTQKRVAVKKPSPALGMVLINQNEEKKYDQYVSDIVDNHIDSFGELCWMEDDNDFQQRLFHLLTRVRPKSDDEAKLLREVFRLIVVTFIMSHTLTLAEEYKHSALSKMRSYAGEGSYVDNYTSPRMANRQLKYYFSRIQRSILSTVLNKLQQIFKSSKGCDKWLAAFVAVLGMCMAHEDQQKTIHLVMETKARTEPGVDHRDAQSKADIACREIDERIAFIQQLFRWKYNRKCNPLRDVEHAWDREVGFGDETSLTFVRQVVQLVKDNRDFLQKRQNVSISHANQTKYTSRLVAQFLLAFWLPS